MECTTEFDGYKAERRTVKEYISHFGGDISEIERVKRRYPMKISPHYLGLIREKGDPIWTQCIPSVEELMDTFNEEDPLEESEHEKHGYVVHKYPDRVLLLVSSKCAMYCRFCTRKRRVGRVSQIPLEKIFSAIGYIEKHSEIRDVILSGGDPFMRMDHEIEEILKRLRAIPHVEIIRIGTRIPCVQPSRITKRLANMLKKYHPLFINTHFNHPMEITPESEQACGILADAGIPMGNQSVLLRGVNDSSGIIRELMQKLLKMRVKPYYIYQCDLVRGVEHFRIRTEEGIDIMKKLQGNTSGLCVPHFVIDGPGGKIPISPQYIKDISPENILLTNFKDTLYSYPNPRSFDIRKTPSTNQLRRLRIGLVYNLKRNPGKNERFDTYSEFDDLDTIGAIKKAIESGGYDVSLCEADADLVQKLCDLDIDFVFNIAEGLNGGSREAQVPAILDMLSIPYSGSGVLTQALSLDKLRCKEILHHHGIPTPRHQLFRKAKQGFDSILQFPLIVKPNFEGSSKGITNDSLVFNRESLMEQVKYVIKHYNQPALVEEFCEGREFTVGIIGNSPSRLLPIVEITFDHIPAEIHPFDSHEVKWTYDNPESDIDPLICPAPLLPKLRSMIEKIALDTFLALGCDDFCRIDIRLDSNGIPNVLDVNALPGLIPDPRQNSRFPRACFTAGMTYDEMILTMLEAGLKRNRLLD